MQACVTAALVCISRQHLRHTGLPAAQVLNVLNTQLQVSNSNRKLLECLEDLVQMVRNSGGIKEAKVEPTPLTPVPPPLFQYNPLAALPA
jgi:hypothetical protein